MTETHLLYYICLYRTISFSVNFCTLEIKNYIKIVQTELEIENLNIFAQDYPENEQKRGKNGRNKKFIWIWKNISKRPE